MRAIGFGMNHSDLLARFVADLDVDVVLCAGRWSLLRRCAFDDLLPVCERRGTSVVVGGVYNSGLLAAPGPDATFDYVQAPPHLVARARRLAAVCAEFGVPLRAAALRFPSATRRGGGRRRAATPAEARENAELFGHDIPDELWRALVGHGLLDDDIPLPV
ncbi:hypothetical protein NKH77_10790 [Streptomyces sp. M19]